MDKLFPPLSQQACGHQKIREERCPNVKGSASAEHVNSFAGDLRHKEWLAASKHKRNKRVRVSIGAPWKRRSMLAMSQLGHYVNRRNVQAAVSQVWPIFFGGRNVLGCLLAPHLLHAPHLNSPSRELLQSTPRRTIREMCVLETPTNIPQRGLRLEFFALCPVCLAGP